MDMSPFAQAPGEPITMFDSRTRLVDDKCSVEVSTKTNIVISDYVLADMRGGVANPLAFSVDHASIRVSQGATSEMLDPPCVRARGRETLHTERYQASPDLSSGEPKDPSELRRFDTGSQRNSRGATGPDRSVPLLDSVRRSVSHDVSFDMPGDTRARGHSVVDGRA